jgi:uncharacterized membrane protein
MYGSGIFLGLVVLIFFIVGSICGIVALSKIQRLVRDLENVRNQLRSLRDDPKKQERQVPNIEKEVEAPTRPAPARVIEPSVVTPVQKEIWASPPPTPPPKMEQTVPPPRSYKSPSQSLEMKLGTKWLNWVGIVMLLVGIGFFLKYAYDNAWIGPKGRLAIGTLLGIIALGLGERFRRRDWSILFQVLTGGGLAIFYLCVFFSFQVYHLADPTITMILAIGVTALAVVMAVAYDAVSIAILAVVGGFLSPVLLSTGTNHPYALFIYVAILDMVAIGAAYFRRWRALDLLCFIGTIVMYLGWHQRFYASNQMIPALVFTSLFYLMFLLIPTLYSLVRRLPVTAEGLVIIILSALLSFISYYHILFRDYRSFMGFAVLGQALLVFLLFQVWSRRVGMDNDTSASFLTITLGLVIIAIPIQIKLYGIPIAWSTEGAVLVLLGIRFRQILCRVAGLVALILAAGGLLYRLPLHSTFFTPFFNITFGSWTFVIAMTAISAYQLYRNEKSQEKWHDALTGISFLLALSLACFLLSVELSQNWTINHPLAHHRTYETGTLVVLWSLIPTVIVSILVRKGAKAWMPLSWVCFGIGAIELFVGLEHYSYPSPWLVLNATFFPKLILVLSLWGGARLCRRLDLKHAADVQALAGHAILALLVALEFERWGHYSSLITSKMGISLISAAWGVQAFVVIWIGLAKQTPLLRYLGFILFFLAVGKTLIIDMSELEKVYRIVSFAACGLLLVAAGYFYQRYSSRILEQPEAEKRA